jgi:CheY-like chemotaxis protein
VRVLVVDDDADLRLLARVVLADAGFDVEEASGGAQALEVLESGEDIDLVVLDIRMPNIDGFAVLERLRAVDLLTRYKIVAVSGHAERETVARAIAEGALAFIQKPFLPEELVAAVNEACQ